jgi:glycosyltransferase involved in cell wall biosynthesis
VPAITVLLPVYNGAPYLAESIDSILNQTWKDFELIILNDGSQDASADIVRGFDDPRIRYYEHENIGLAATLNRGIALSVGAIIARQDQDDISLPERFERQLAFLSTHPECVMVGTWAEIWSVVGLSGRALRHPPGDALIKLELLFDNPFVHSSMMIRRETLQKVGGYSIDPLRQPPEDYELWSRMARHGEVANISESLVIYREVGGSMSRSTDSRYLERMVTICCENVHTLLGDDYDRALVRGVVCFFHGVDVPESRPSTKDIKALMRDLERILTAKYPEDRVRLQAGLIRFYNIVLLFLYTRYINKRFARVIVLCRSLFLFCKKGRIQV